MAGSDAETNGREQLLTERCRKTAQHTGIELGGRWWNDAVWLRLHASIFEAMSAMLKA